MSTQTSHDQSSVDASDTETTATVQELAAQIEVLREENRRLRTKYAHTRRREYRQAALGIGLLGGVAALGGVIFPASQATLFALAGIGLFTGVLTYYLTPERFVAASVGERTYAALATLGADLVSELGLQETRLYVPTSNNANETAANVQLFVPEHANYTVPDTDQLESLFVVTDDERSRGVAVSPTGLMLFREFQQTMTDSLADTPTELADQLTEATIEGFELAEDAVANLDSNESRMTVGIRDSAFGAVDRFDHPIVSFIATGLAAGLQIPIQVETTVADDDRFDYLITYTWNDNLDSTAA